VGAYIGKNVRERVDADKGARLVSYIGFKQGGRKASCRLGWNTDNGWLWRHKLGAYAERNGCRSTEDLVKLFGPRWAYRLQAEILMERLDEVHPSWWAMQRSRELQHRGQDLRTVARVNSEQGKVFARTVVLDRKKLWTKKR
jgi:hypothetical protein